MQLAFWLFVITVSIILMGQSYILFKHSEACAEAKRDAVRLRVRLEDAINELRAADSRSNTLSDSLYRVHTATETLRKDLNLTAQVVEANNGFIETVKATAKESTRASAARIAALQNRNLR